MKLVLFNLVYFFYMGGVLCNITLFIYFFYFGGLNLGEYLAYNLILFL